MILSIIAMSFIMLIGSFFHLPMFIILLLGLLPFIWLSLKKGFLLNQLLEFSLTGLHSLKKTYLLLLLIGGTTALWNDTGTMSGILSLCTHFITDYNFLLVTFLITWVVTLLLGSALGTAGTIGVLFINIAITSNYSLAMTGGAIVSAIYLGERTSPVSTCANLVADINQISIFDYISYNFKNISPLLIVVIILYGLLSICFPIQLPYPIQNPVSNGSTVDLLIGIIPILFLIGSTLLYKNVVVALLSSIFISFPISFWINNLPIPITLNHFIFGVNTSLNSITINGKGLYGMIPTLLVVMVSAIYGGLFKETGIFEPLKENLLRLSNRYSPYPATLVASLFGGSIGCSQTFSVIFTHSLLQTLYGDEPSSRLVFSNHLADTAVMLPALIPWNIAASVPAILLGTGYQYMPFAFLIYLPALIGLGYSIQFSQKSKKPCG